MNILNKIIKLIEEYQIEEYLIDFRDIIFESENRIELDVSWYGLESSLMRIEYLKDLNESFENGGVYFDNNKLIFIEDRKKESIEYQMKCIINNSIISEISFEDNYIYLQDSEVYLSFKDIEIKSNIEDINSKLNQTIFKS